MTEISTLTQKSTRTRLLGRLARLGMAITGLGALLSAGAASTLLDSGASGAAISTTAAATKCGAKLNWYMDATWVVPGVNDLFVGFSSSGYYYYCGDIVGQVQHRVCNNLYYGLIDFECTGSPTSGVIGEGTSHVNPWYNQPVNIVVLFPGEDDFPSIGIYGGTIYCRSNFYSSGKYNNNCSLSITSHSSL
jgi:hypothetical protein